MNGILRRRRGMMGEKAESGPVYIIKAGVAQPIVEAWENIGYKRGTSMTVTASTGALVFNVPSNKAAQTGTLTVSPIIFPKGRTKLKFKAKCSYTPASNNVQYYITAAESVKTATTYAGAFTNYKRYAFTGTSVVTAELDISGYESSGFYLAITIDRITNSSQTKTVTVYDLWIE